jgi:MFS family permease
VFFVGYVLGPIPSNLLLNYLGRPSAYIGVFGVAWGLVTLLTSQVKGYGSLAACRFILGVVGKPSFLFWAIGAWTDSVHAIEAPLFPGIMFYLSVGEDLSRRYRPVSDLYRNGTRRENWVCG